MHYSKGLVVGLCFLLLVFSGSARAASPEEFLSDWRPDGGVVRGATSSAHLRTEQYNVDKPMAEVWTEYARKLGITGDFTSTVTNSVSTSGNTGQLDTSVVCAQAVEGGVRSAIFTRRSGHALLVIQVSGIESGKKTVVGLVAELR